MTERGPRPRRKLAAILMADVSGFSRLMGADEEGTTARIREFHSRLQARIEEHAGRVVDTAGDSVFGEFDSVVEAVRCAHQIQVDQTQSNAEIPPERRIETRIGIHLGDVIVEDYRVWGDGVNVAARLEQLAEPGGIWVSEAVYQQVHNKLDLRFEDLGIRELKNIPYPLRLYRAAGAAAPGARPPVPVRRRAALPSAPAGVRWLEESSRARALVPAALALSLLLSPVLLFPTRGLLPALGAVLLALALGGVWARVAGRPAHRWIALGAGLVACAAFTDWSQVTNGLFVVAGSIVAAAGVARRQRAR